MSSLALDVGGTFIKAARVANGRVLEPVVRTAIPTFTTHAFDEGARVLDPGQLDAAVLGTLTQLGLERLESEHVFVSGQMAGLAFVDHEGHAVGGIITWQDTRFRGVEALTRAIGEEAVTDLGDGLRVGSPAVTLSECDPPDGTSPMSLIAYVAGRIGSGRAERVHATDAGAWGLFDTRRMQWSARACRAAGVNEGLLPEVVTNIEPILPGSRVFTGVGDQQAALFGAGLRDDQVSVNLATGCQVSTVASDFATGVQSRPYLTSQYLHTVTHLPAGRLLTAAVAETYGATSDIAWERAAQEWERATLVRAAVETISQGITDAVSRLKADGREVLFSGGLVQRFSPLRESILERLGSPRSRVFPGDDAALAGLAVLAEKNA